MLLAQLNVSADRYLMEAIQNNRHLSGEAQISYFKPFLSEGFQGERIASGKETSFLSMSDKDPTGCVSQHPALGCRISRECMTPTQQIENLLVSEVKTPDANLIGRSFFTSIHQLHKDDNEYEVELINVEDYKSTHHLLKHYLSDGQRTAALEHFGVIDVKEAAKMVSKMGQREMQQKFKLVYGTTTHSNNNDWLRRKLYEAIGAAPAKLPVKNHSKKNQSRGRKSKSKLSTGAVLEKQVRSRKMSCKLLDTSHPGDLPRTPVTKNGVSRIKSVSASSPFGSSVVDMHKYIAIDYFSTSDEDIVSGMISADTDFAASTHNTLSDQTVAGNDWRKSSFDSCESLGFVSIQSMPILFGDDITEWDTSEAERRKSNAMIDKKQIEYSHQATKTLEEDEDVLLPVDSSAINMVDILKDFL